MVSRTIKIPFLSPWGDLGNGLVSDPSILSTETYTATFWYECWNLIQTELNYQWWVLSCSQDDVRCFQWSLDVFTSHMFLDVLRVFSIAHRYSIDILRCVRDVFRCSWMFLDVLLLFSRCSQDVLNFFAMMFWGCFHNLSIMFSGCSHDILRILWRIWWVLWKYCLWWYKRIWWSTSLCWSKSNFKLKYAL